MVGYIQIHTQADRSMVGYIHTQADRSMVG